MSKVCDGIPSDKTIMTTSGCSPGGWAEVGFILSSDLPCTKNIQKIVSVFANRTGRICRLVSYQKKIFRP